MDNRSSLPRFTPRPRSSTLLFAALALAALGVSGVVWGQTCDGEISGVIYRDYNANGARDSREPGVGGVGVVAYDSTGVAVGIGSTGSDGTYSLPVFNGVDVRVEFINVPDGFFLGPQGSDSVSATFFTTSPNCAVSHGVLRPEEYCEADPELGTPCYVVGDRVGPGAAVDAVITLQYSATGTGGGPMGVPHNIEAVHSQVGSTYGLAYDRETTSLFAGAYMKRHVGFGPGGTGAIYRIDRTGMAVTTYVDVNALFGPGTAGADPHPSAATMPPPMPATDFNVDAAGYDPVGKISWGDIEVDEPNRMLYGVNLSDRMLYEIPILPVGMNPTMAQINTFAIPVPPGTAMADFRPFGLGFKDGILYVGIVDSAESTQMRTDMEGFVYSFDPATATFSPSPLLSFPLDYERGCAIGGATCSPTPGGTRAADWLPWKTTWTLNPPSGFEAVHPQPMFSDIVFDNDYLIVGLRDRMSDQSGYRRPDTFAGAVFYEGMSAGDILVAAPDGMGGWTIESDSSVGTRGPTLGQGNMEGPGGGEFFRGDNFTLGAAHDETSFGGLTQVPGFPEVVSSTFDAFSIYEQAIEFFSHETGLRARAARILQEAGGAALPPGPPPPGAMFGKSSGLGDVEPLCSPPPIEIGNRIWRDRNRNGIQDAGEDGIAGVTVSIFSVPGGMLLGSVVTDANGNYLFNDANVAGGLQLATSYQLRLDNPADFNLGGPLFQLTLTALNQGSEDKLDSDGIILPSTDPGLNLTTTSEPGDNVHVFDLGFLLPGSIGDRVWHDINGDMVQDPGEPGFATVRVRLFRAGADGLFGTIDDIEVDTQLTDFQGGYDFFPLEPGNYRVVVDETSAPLAGFGITTGNNPFDHTLPPGQDFNDADFGYRRDTNDASIGDFIWNDVNGDGVQDGGEMGIPSVTVRLLSPGPDGIFGTPDDVVEDMQVTDANGNYDFTMLPAGEYCIDVDESTLPVGFVLTSQNEPLKKTLNVGEDFDDGDFGYRPDASNGSIGDLVWADANGNGTFDGGELGIPGVTVNLREAGPDGVFGTGDDVTFPPMVTDAMGMYLFMGLPAGRYRVDVDETSPPLVGLGLTSGNEPRIVDLFQSQMFLDADFGYVAETTTGAIGDFVWHDVDGDGFQDAGEPGISGVMLQLIGPGADGILGTGDDAVLATTTTSFTGLYLFSTLPAGDYQVNVVDATIPPGFDEITTFNDPMPVTLNVGQTFRRADFGYRDSVTGEIGDFVWNDLNLNGVFDVGEPPLGFVKVDLIIPGSDQILGTTDDLVLATTLTNFSGFYLFSTLPAGDYQVNVDFAASPALSGLALTTANEPLDETLTAGESFLMADFGYGVDTVDASIGDFVWNDLNGDGIQDGGPETGIPGVTVELLTAGPDGIFGTVDDVLVATMVTDAMGAYDFTGLPAERYRVNIVEATLPPGSVLTTDNEPLIVNVAPGDDFDDADFGYLNVPPATIGDTVFMDTNLNGVQDGEPGIPGVTVNLFSPGPDGLLGTPDDVLEDTQITDGSGNYLFTGLPAGDYRVQVDPTSPPLAGLALTTLNNPTDLTMTAGQTDLTVDFGYGVDPVTGVISGMAYIDSNCDGTFQPMAPFFEFALGLADVRLFDVGPDGIAGTGDDFLAAGPVPTDFAGMYSFMAVPAGNYYLTIDTTPAGFPFPTGVVVEGATPHLVALAPGGMATMENFGVAFGPLFGGCAAAFIGDFVWNDLDLDGVQDGGAETGIDGVTINLIWTGLDGLPNTADDVPASMLSTPVPPAMTAGGGMYLFGDGFTTLPVGRYIVDVEDNTVPTGLVLTTGNDPMIVEVSAGQMFLDADFGYAPSSLFGSIGDFVWYDEDRDGIYDATENGLPGILIELFNDGPDGVLGTGDDVLFRTQSTGQNGSYDFLGLPADNYRVNVVEATLPVAFQMGLTTRNEPLDKSLALGEDYNLADFGYADPHTTSIGDFIWEDTSCDGIQDGGEPGIAGVTVDLLIPGLDGEIGTADDLVLATTVTDAMGMYLFDELPSGTYRVRINLLSIPSGFGITTGNNPLDQTLAVGQAFLDADFGFKTDTNTGEIGDFIWDDLNCDGIQDGGEPGIMGVTVRLFNDGFDGILGTPDDELVGTMMTDAMGAYNFTGLPAGNYRVEVDDTTVGGLVSSTLNDPLTVQLSIDEDFDDADFGYKADPVTSSIGDFVWLDLDGGMDQDGTPEDGIDGVTIILEGAGPDGIFGTGDDLATQMTTTAGGGVYGFAMLPAGRYRVSVDSSTLPTGLGLTTGNEPLIVDLAPGQAFLDADFGYREDPSTGIIGDYVWHDLDCDGIQDPGEPPFESIFVRLFTPGPDGVLGTGDDVEIGVTATDSMGRYYFLERPAGLYRVEVDTSTLPSPLFISSTMNNPTDTLLNVGEQDFTVDFGWKIPLLSNVGDEVWYDSNADGIRDAGEGGIPGVVLNLLLDGMPTGMSTVTGLDGIYTFQDLPAGNYTVVVDPSNLMAGGALDGLVSTTGGEVHGPFVLPAGTHYLLADFGYVGPGFSAGDFIWSDIDNDGIQDPGEAGIGGVLLNLRDLGADGIPFTADDMILDTRTTAANGYYLFTGLAAGNFYIEVDPSNFLPAGPLDGYTVTTGPESLGTDMSGVFITGSTLFPTGARPHWDTIDWGYFRMGLGTIGDFVWNDINQDGIQDPGEAGFRSVTLNLYEDSNGNGVIDAGEPVIATAITDAMGGYLFTGLPAGDYIVDVTDTGAVLTVFNSTTGNDPLAVSLAAGQDFTTADFGYANVGIGDFVFLDENGNGLQDPEEDGIGNVDLFLYGDEDGNGLVDPSDPLLFTTRTNGDGYYYFPDLPDGAYVVRVGSGELGSGQPLEGMMLSPALVGGDPTVDSNGALGLFGDVDGGGTLAGASNVTLDFGFFGTLSLGDFVWLDQNCDGVQDVGEPPIAGVTIDLYRDLDGDGILDPEDSHFGQDTSDAGGIYSFNGLPLGDYIVVITDEANILAGRVQTFGMPTTAVSLAASTDAVDFGFKDIQPLHAVISSVSAVNDGGATYFVWQTAAEIDTLGFHVYREDAPGVWTPIQGIVTSAGAMAGATYHVVDSAASVGSSQTYKLIEVEFSGARNTYGPYDVVVKPGRFAGAGTPYGSAARPAVPSLAKKRSTVRGMAKVATSERAKIAVREDGIIRVSCAELARVLGMGAGQMELAAVTGRLQLTNRGRNVPYHPEARGQSIAFYGQGPGDDLYANENVYWASLGRGSHVHEVGGFGPTTKVTLQTVTPSIPDVAHFEEQHYWQAKRSHVVDPLLDYWMWDLVVAGVAGLERKSFDLDLADVADSHPHAATLKVRLLAPGAGSHHVTIRIAGQTVGASLWNGQSVHEVACSVPHSLLSAGSNPVEIEATLQEGDFDIVFLDSFELHYRRPIRAEDGQLRATGLPAGVATIGGFTDPDIQVWDVTDPSAPILNSATTLTADPHAPEYQISFESPGTKAVFLVQNPHRERSADAVWADVPSKLRHTGNACDYLVITTADLEPAASRLADYRRQGGHTTKVVLVEDILDEFNHGVVNPWALADFLRHTQTSWRNAPRYVVLAGAGNYDYREYAGHGGNLVPPTLVQTTDGMFPSDAVLAGRGDHLLRDLMIGRLPAATEEELNALIDKIIAHESSEGAWRTRTIFLADDTDAFGSYAAASESARALLPAPMTSTPIYLDLLPVATARQELMTALANGAWLLHYHGHSGLVQMAEEGLLRVADVPALPAHDRLPIVTGVSCLAGHFAVPGYPSVGEALVRKVDGGAVAAWLPAGLVLSEQGEILDRAFLEAVTRERTLGEAVSKATEVYLREGTTPALPETMILLGDPALQLR